MIRADIGFTVTAGLFANPGASVATNIVHCADFAGFCPRDDDRVFADLNELIITGRGDLAGMKRINPAFENQVFKLLLMD